MTSAVPKPENAGAGRTAIADTRKAYVNLRSGPGTNYRDIGDVRDKSLVIYYPDTRNNDDWVWVEQNGVGGWVHTGYVTFEDVISQPTTSTRPTPYDNAVALWHWKGNSVPYTTIDQFAAAIKAAAPNVTQVWVKVSDGPNWMGEFDEGDLAINGPQDVDRWVQVLNTHGLQFHAWGVPTGEDMNAEADIIAAVCNRPGVRSMILDVEPYVGFWRVGRDPIRPLMIRIRQMIPDRFHIGMSMDPRPWHYDSIFPDEWLPFINSVHPQVYWHTFQNTPEEALQMAYDTWRSYGLPIIPALQGDAPLEEQDAAHTLATKRYGASGLSWWRFGVIPHYSIVNRPVTVDVSPAVPQEEPTGNFAEEVIVFPGGDGFRSGSYTGRDEFQRFTGTWGWEVYYTTTESRRSKVWAEWKTALPATGTYQISVFVPARNATTSNARYKIHGIKGTDTEVIVEIDQWRHHNQWVSLGIFELVKGAPNAGKVFLNDVTFESGRLIAFDAVRFRRIVTSTPDGNTGTTTPAPAEPGQPTIIDGVFVADGFDSPVGTAAERTGDRVWPAGWRDASPYAQLYFIGSPREAYHTGADLNFGKGPYDDLGVPVYSSASGIVIFQADLSVWGNVTIIRHDPLYTPDGKIVYTRYGHMQNVRVKVGDRVQRGQLIGEIGSGGGRYIPHLHFDVVTSTVLETKPGDWPGKDLARLLKHYADPLQFILDYRPAR